MGPNIKPIKNSKLSILFFLDIKKLLAIPLTPVIRPFRIKNKKTEKPIVIPPINADIGVKLTIFIKILKPEIQDSYLKIFFDILA